MKLTNVSGTMSANIKGRAAGIKMSAAFAINLTRRQYGNAFLAALREVITNAADAHVSVRKSDVPFEIHVDRDTDLSEMQLVELGKALEKETNAVYTIRVRDYGPGMSEDFLHKQYFCLGDSSKQEQEDQGGGFGIGAKAVFATTDICQVSVYDGEFRYTVNGILAGEDGIVVTDVEKSPSDQPRGTEVSFLVELPKQQLNAEGLPHLIASGPTSNVLAITLAKVLFPIGHKNSPYQATPRLWVSGKELRVPHVNSVEYHSPDEFSHGVVLCSTVAKQKPTAYGYSYRSSPVPSSPHWPTIGELQVLHTGGSLPSNVTPSALVTDHGLVRMAVKGTSNSSNIDSVLWLNIAYGLPESLSSRLSRELDERLPRVIELRRKLNSVKLEPGELGEPWDGSVDQLLAGIPLASERDEGVINLWAAMEPLGLRLQLRECLTLLCIGADQSLDLTPERVFLADTAKNSEIISKAGESILPSLATLFFDSWVERHKEMAFDIFLQQYYDEDIRPQLRRWIAARIGDWRLAYPSLRQLRTAVLGLWNERYFGGEEGLQKWILKDSFQQGGYQFTTGARRTLELVTDSVSDVISYPLLVGERETVQAVRRLYLPSYKGQEHLESLTLSTVNDRSSVPVVLFDQASTQAKDRKQQLAERREAVKQYTAGLARSLAPVWPTKVIDCEALAEEYPEIIFPAKVKSVNRSVCSIWSLSIPGWENVDVKRVADPESSYGSRCAKTYIRVGAGAGQLTMRQLEDCSGGFRRHLRISSVILVGSDRVQDKLDQAGWLDIRARARNDVVTGEIFERRRHLIKAIEYEQAAASVLRGELSKLARVCGHKSIPEFLGISDSEWKGSRLEKLRAYKVSRLYKRKPPERVDVSGWEPQLLPPSSWGSTGHSRDYGDQYARYWLFSYTPSGEELSTNALIDALLYKCERTRRKVWLKPTNRLATVLYPAGDNIALREDPPSSSSIYIRTLWSHTESLRQLILKREKQDGGPTRAIGSALRLRLAYLKQAFME